MKKNIKLILALVLSIMMVLGSMSALADDDPTGSITMAASNDNTVAAAGKTFNAYKVLDVVISSDGEKYAYTIPNSTIKAQLATKLSVSAQGDEETDIAYEQRIIKAIEDATDVEATAKLILEAAKAANITPDVINGTTTKSNLPLGYYVIEDVTTTGDNKKPVSAVALTTTNPNVTIKVKATKPTLDKVIDEGNTAKTWDAADLTYDNHAIGDKVPYVLKTTIPEMTGYTKYFFIVNDTMSKGLTFNNDVEVKAVGDSTRTLVAYNAEAAAAAAAAEEEYEYDYTVTSGAVVDENDEETGETWIKIVFNDFVTKEKEHAGDVIHISYSATVNTDAIIGVEGNPNTATLIYSDNPNIVPQSDTDEPDDEDDDITSETPDDTVYTYVTGLEVVKQDATTKERLAGAKFKLEGTDLLNTVLVEKEVFTEDEDGEYFALTDGSYTKDDPTKLNKDANNYQELLDKYVDKTGNTKYTRTIETDTTITKAENKAYEGTTDANGTILFDGLKAGTYTLTELISPEGYNLLTGPVSVTITWTAPGTGSTECTWSSAGNNLENGVIVVKIDNNKGAQLPETGGIGTTLFYVGGSILVLLAVVLLVTKRRMGSND